MCVRVLRWNKEAQRGEVCPNWFIWDPKKQKELTNPKLAEAAYEECRANAISVAPDSGGHLCSAATISLLTSHPSQPSLWLLLCHYYIL